MDLEFSLFDAEFNALFDSVIFKIDILQLLWSASTVQFHCATIDVHGSVTQLTWLMHFQLCSRLS